MRLLLSKRFLLLALGGVAFCCVIAFSDAALAQYTYTPLEEIPGSPKDGDFVKYVMAIYKFAMWAVGLAAILMLTIGGFMYMSSAGNKALAESAKTVIKDALFGLLMALLAYLLLFVINPDLVNVNLSTLSSLKVTTSTTTPSGPGGGAVTGTCGGVPMAGINPTQCADASPALTNMTTCIQSKVPNAQITSISDDDATGNLSKCQGSSYSKPSCDHTKDSCHYGGTGNGSKSCAVDLSTNGVSASELESAAKSCGAVYTKNEGNHVHASVAGCSCDNHS